MNELRPAAQAVRLPLDQIIRELHQYSRFSFSATDTLPFTIETNETGLHALIDALCAAALRAAADEIYYKRHCYGKLFRSDLITIAEELESAAHG